MPSSAPCRPASCPRDPRQLCRPQASQGPRVRPPSPLDLHFTPTSGSWLNAVETFFSALTPRRLKRGSFRSTVDLQAAINRYIVDHNAEPKPFIWTQPADQILARMNRLNASVH
jgi:hypothetical protein